MFSVHVRIGHNDNLVVAQPADIEVIAVAFRKTTAERVDHRLADLRRLLRTADDTF